MQNKSGEGKECHPDPVEVSQMNYNFLLVFVLAHLAGDFALQTDRISKNKSASLKGLAVHAGIITVLQTIFLSIYGLRGALIGLACGVIHFALDFAKEQFGKTLKKRFWYFLLDQALHLSVIASLTLLFAPSSALFPVEELYVKMSIIVFILAFVSGIAAKMLLRDMDEAIAAEPFFKKNERISDAIICAAVFVSMLLPFPAFLLPVAVGYYLYMRFMKSAFQYTFAISAIKFTVYVLISYGMVLLLRWG